MKNVITIIFLFLPCILFSQETFEVKRIDSVGSYFSPYGGLKRLCNDMDAGNAYNRADCFVGRAKSNNAHNFNGKLT